MAAANTAMFKKVPRAASVSKMATPIALKLSKLGVLASMMCMTPGTGPYTINLERDVVAKT